MGFGHLREMDQMLTLTAFVIIVREYQTRMFERGNDAPVGVSFSVLTVHECIFMHEYLFGNSQVFQNEGMKDCGACALR